MDTSISTPINSKQQYTRIMIPPHMMNSDIVDNMTIVLQQKVENKCNRYGFIQKVHYIEKYEECIILPENFSGGASYNIIFMCKIVIPIENTVIVGTVKALNPELAIIVNGPIIVFIPKAHIDTNIWDVSNEFTEKKNRTILKQEDYVKVHLDKVKIDQGEVQIKCIGKLMGRANEEEIKMVYGTTIESNFI